MPHLALLDNIIDEGARTNEVPVRLVQQAWADPESREAIIDMLLESLQKLGGFEKVPFWMEAICASISRDGIVELYKELRSRSVRNELEWRLAFQATFPQCKEQLPVIEERSIRSSNHLNDYLVKATEDNDTEAAALLIDCMLRVGLDPRSVRIATLEDLGLSDDELQEMNADDLGALIKKVNRERGIPIRDYAIELGNDRIVQLLDSLNI
jgi:hypothetical protein